MTIQQVRKKYLILYIAAIFAVLISKKIYCYNLFPEVGAAIIIFAIWRGTRSIKSLNWGSSDYPKIREGVRRTALQWDITAGAIGTAINGFSVLEYKLLDIIL